MNRRCPVEAIHACAAKVGPTAKEASCDSGFTAGQMRGVFTRPTH